MERLVNGMVMNLQWQIPKIAMDITGGFGFLFLD